MFERDFKPLFKLEHMLKDVRHCLDEARALGVELRLGSLVEPLSPKAAETGHAEEDFAAVIRALESYVAFATKFRVETWAPRS